MTISANLGLPRIGLRRELKKALEAYWKGDISQTALLEVSQDIKQTNWEKQSSAGIDIIPSNDFSFYDHVLDTTLMLGAIPARFEESTFDTELDLYFAMARGTEKATAMEMTKWFDTNYHYIVPELTENQTFKISNFKPLAEYNQAKALGYETRPVILGPITWLSLAKTTSETFDKFSLLPALLAEYQILLGKLKAAGAEWVQIDEPILALDLSAQQLQAFTEAYTQLNTNSPKIMLATYFDSLRDNLETVSKLPIAGLHIDLVRAPQQLDAVLRVLGKDTHLSIGVIDGRNIWRSDLDAKLELVRKAWDNIGPGRLQIAPSCSLLHVPVDLATETKLDEQLKSWLAFATQKLDEVAILTIAIQSGANAVAQQLSEAKAALNDRKVSTRTFNTEVRTRTANIQPADYNRKSSFASRITTQQELLNLPNFPTTTIGSFPQTQDIREARASYKKGHITEASYNAFLELKTQEAIAKQEALDIDVFVHGEFERNDMVEYFGEQLNGFAFSQNGWVQSYGSRCVKPPIIFGDVSRPTAMTVKWSEYAQSLTSKPMKGMLTGPVTILQWSFVRDDQARSITCEQIALAIRDEVQDLETAGISIIQIDEPALREGLPLRTVDHEAYLLWAVNAFKLSAAIARDTTQIHTHMCYAEFNDIMDAISAMDADVISIETSRSAMELLKAFETFKYPNDIGPGVWDIHAPRVPSKAEMEALITRALELIPAERIWINPDCGLKTRNWPEVESSLANLVEVAKSFRAKFSA